MRWKTPVKPKLDEIRVISVFCWLPRRAPDGYTYWLTTAYIRQKYVHYVRYGGKWKDIDDEGNIL